MAVRHLACSTLGKPEKPNFQFLCELTEKFMKDPVWWCGGVAVRHLACSTLGKPKKPNFEILCELTGKFKKDPVWWCGLWFYCDNNTYPSLGLRLRL